MTDFELKKNLWKRRLTRPRAVEKERGYGIGVSYPYAQSHGYIEGSIMTVKEVKEALDKYYARDLGALPVGYFKDNGEFVEIRTLIRVVDDYAGEVIKVDLDWQNEEAQIAEERE